MFTFRHSLGPKARLSLMRREGKTIDGYFPPYHFTLCCQPDFQGKSANVSCMLASFLSCSYIGTPKSFGSSHGDMEVTELQKRVISPS